MKVCVIQPPYSRDTAFCDDYFDFKLKMLDKCDDSLDIIVLPEYSDVPCVTKDLEETLYYHKKYFDTLMKRCAETAKKCSSPIPEAKYIWSISSSACPRWSMRTTPYIPGLNCGK